MWGPDSLRLFLTETKTDRERRGQRTYIIADHLLSPGFRLFLRMLELIFDTWSQAPVVFRRRYFELHDIPLSTDPTHLRPSAAPSPPRRRMAPTDSRQLHGVLTLASLPYPLLSLYTILENVETSSSTKPAETSVSSIRAGVHNRAWRLTRIVTAASSVSSLRVMSTTCAFLVYLFSRTSTHPVPPLCPRIGRRLLRRHAVPALPQ